LETPTGTKGLLVPGAKNTEANAKLGHHSKVCSLVVVAWVFLLMIDNCG